MNHKLPIAILTTLLLATLSFAQDDEASLRKAISQNPKDYVLITKLGVICQEKANKKEAIILFRKAVKIDPDFPPPHIYLGRLYFLMQKSDDAVREFELFREKSKLSGGTPPQNTDAYVNDLNYISDVYFTLDMCDKAKEVTEEVLKLDPSNQAACYNMGVYYYTYAHSRSRAYQYFTKALNLNPSNHIGKSAKYAIEFMRNNPDSRMAPDMSFINKEYRD